MSNMVSVSVENKLAYCCLSGQRTGQKGLRRTRTEVGSSHLVTLAYPILEFEHPQGRHRLTYLTHRTPGGTEMQAPTKPFDMTGTGKTCSVPAVNVTSSMTVLTTASSDTCALPATPFDGSTTCRKQAPA